MSLLVTACGGGGSSADPPSNVTALAGDTVVTLTWNAASNVDYWIFYSTDPSITPGNFVNQPNAHVVREATSPHLITGLSNGVTYYFTINGRTDNGPGGSGSPAVSATPRPAGTVWFVGPSFTSSDLHGAAYATTAGFVVVGVGGQIFNSADTATWNPQTSNVTSDLFAVSNINNQYVAVGAGGTTVRSTDGVTWTATQVGVQDLYAIARTGTANVAVGANGAIATSSDAVTWLGQVSGTSANLRGVAYSGSIYVAVGDNGTILSSTDLITWTARSAGVAANLRGVTYGLGKFVAVGDGGTILVSTDGITWSVSPNPTNDTLYDVNVGTQFVAVGANGRIVKSIDGVTWTTATSNTTATLFGIGSSGTSFVAVGAGGVNVASF